MTGDVSPHSVSKQDSSSDVPTDDLNLADSFITNDGGQRSESSINTSMEDGSAISNTPSQDGVDVRNKKQPVIRKKRAGKRRPVAKPPLVVPCKYPLRSRRTLKEVGVM